MEMNDNSREQTLPFANEEEYLAGLFQLEAIRLKFYYNSEIAALGERPRSVNKFLPSMDEVGCLLEKKIEEQAPSGEFQVMLSWEEYFRARIGSPSSGNVDPYGAAPAEETSFASGAAFAGEKLCRRFSLSEFGRSALVLSLMAEIDGDYRSILQFLQGNIDSSYPTPEFCAKVFFHQKRQLVLEFYREAEKELGALSLLFPALAESETPYLAQMIPDRRLISLVMGGGDVSPYYLESCDSAADLPPLFFREKERQKAEACLQGKPGGLIFLYGEKGAGKKHFIRHLCREESGVVFCHLSLVEEEPPGKKEKQALSVALREAVFQNVPLAITGLESYDQEQKKRLVRWVRQETEVKCPAVFLLCDNETPFWGEDELFLLELAPLDESQRRQVWEFYSTGDLFQGDWKLSSLANTFAFTPGRIVTALQTARHLSGGPGNPLDKELIYQVCYGLVEHKLAEKAKRVKTNFCWADLKLAKEEKEILRDICNRVKNKHIVMSEWGFSRILPYGGGISAVFAGPPGTGKTMAAQVMANELNMELYQTDLSQVVDKYIGETEKNIRLIFDQARKSNSILFFDEADALFGKRVEAVSSNDRFANIESSLLLQCMEEYSGISLLATNHYSAIDPAFVRRFKYLVNFRLPDAGLRLEIWESVFPQGAPLSEELDFPWLAGKFELTGAYIKNIALSAAFLAAEEGAAVNMLHILKGLKREMAKESRMLEQSQLGSFGYLFGSL